MSDANQSEAWEADNRVITFCPECRVYPGNIIDEFSSGDTVCADCGLVLGERIVDTRSEWRTFANDEKTGADPCRVGDAANPLLNGAQLETQIEVQGGNKLSDLHRAHRRASEANNSRQLLSAYAEIGAYCDSIQITQHVCTTAKVLYKLVEDNKALRKKPRAGIIAGCIFIACRQCAVPRTFTEIFALTKVPKMEIGRIFKLLEKFFSTYSASRTAAMAKPGKTVPPSHEYATTTATTAESLMIRFCNNLGLGQKATLIAEDLAKRVANDDILAGRSTLTCTGAIVYMVSHLVGNGKRIRDIAAVLGVSDSTVRKAYKTLYHCRCSMIDQKWLESHGGDMGRLPPL